MDTVPFESLQNLIKINQTDDDTDNILNKHHEQAGLKAKGNNSMDLTCTDFSKAKAFI